MCPFTDLDVIMGITVGLAVGMLTGLVLCLMWRGK